MSNTGETASSCNKKCERAVEVCSSGAERLVNGYSSSVVRCLLILALATALTSQADASYMKCKSFCAMMTDDELQQLWCVYNMCRQGKLGNHILRYAKRQGHESTRSSWAGLQNLLTGNGFPSAKPRATARKPGQWEEDVQKNMLMRRLSQTRGVVEEQKLARPAAEKRDVEYWDGPAPADINA